MNKAEWLAIAEVLRGLRVAVEAKWPPRDAPDPAAPSFAAAQIIHQQKITYLAQLEELDQVATVLAAALDRLSPNFDLHHFMRVIGGK